MKKFVSMIAAVMSALLLCTSVFAANAENPDAYTVYKYAMKKLDEAATIKTTAKYTLMDDLEANVTLTQTQTGSKGLQMEARMHEDGDTVVNVYYKDGYYYQRIRDGSPNKKRKTKMSEEQAIVECYGINRNLKRSAFEDATLERTNTGYTLKYKVSGKEFSGIFGNLMTALLKEYEELDSLSIKTGSVTYVLDIGKDGTLQSYRISFITTLYDRQYGFGSDMTNVVNCKVTTESKAQKINYPENLDVYKEIEL